MINLFIKIFVLLLDMNIYQHLSEIFTFATEEYIWINMCNSKLKSYYLRYKSIQNITVKFRGGKKSLSRKTLITRWFIREMKLGLFRKA